MRRLKSLLGGTSILIILAICLALGSLFAAVPTFEHRLAVTGPSAGYIERYFAGLGIVRRPLQETLRVGGFLILISLPVLLGVRRRSGRG